MDSLKLNKNIDNAVNENIFNDTEIKNVTLNSISTLGFEEINLKDRETLLKKLTSQKIKIELKGSQEWRFKTDRIDIKDSEWFSKKLLLTNDPFNKPQLVIKNNDFKSISSNNETTLTSKWSTLVLDDKLYIPTGPRRYKVDDDNLLKWGVGYNKDSKDGLFITRNFDPKYFRKRKDTKLNLKKNFIFKGH